MEKVFRINNGSYCKHIFFKKIFVDTCISRLNFAKESFLSHKCKRSYCTAVRNKNNNYLLQKHGLNYDQMNPAILQFCNFHFNSQHFKNFRITERHSRDKIDRSKKMPRLKKNVTMEKMLNKNWHKLSRVSLENVDWHDSDEHLEEIMDEINKSSEVLKGDESLTTESSKGEIDDEHHLVGENVRNDWTIKSANNVITVPETKAETNMVEAGQDEIEDFTNLEEEKDDVYEYVPPVKLERGITGVYDIEELVTLLESENAKDICVIRLQEALQLADYMVIVSGLSIRHCKAISARVQYIHKRKKSERDRFVILEGVDTDEWFSFDLGNIILHIFMPEQREIYDLETLWTVGEKHDSQCLESDNPYNVLPSDMQWLRELNAPENVSTEKTETQL